MSFIHNASHNFHISFANTEKLIYCPDSTVSSFMQITTREQHQKKKLCKFVQISLPQYLNQGAKG
jgi:hypothetical protein